jgi:hypothetical protein
MKSDKDENTSLETECLFGETVEILDKYKNLVYCKLSTDNYCGWIRKSSLGKYIQTTHRVIVKRTYIYKKKDAKSDVLFYIPMGSHLATEEIKHNWAKIYFSIERKTEVGYVPSNHIVELKNQCKDWVSMAEQLEGIPYRWGGRDTLGVDCSALLQLAYQAYGQKIPRNTSQQLKLEKRIIHNFENLERGCVVFWEGHVGIMTDKNNCIHANGFYMKTTIEPLRKIIGRMAKDFSVIKMMNFN